MSQAANRASDPPAAADAKPTITHIGVWAEDVRATVARVKQEVRELTDAFPLYERGRVGAGAR